MWYGKDMPVDHWIAPSILSADFSRLGAEIEAVLEGIVASFPSPASERAPRPASSACSFRLCSGTRGPDSLSRSGGQ